MVTYIVSGEILSETDGRIFNNIPGEKRYVGIDEHINATVAKLYVDFLISAISGNLVGKTRFGDMAAAIVEFIESVNGHSLSSFLH